MLKQPSYVLTSAQVAGIQRLFDLAEQNGMGAEFRFVYEQAADKYGLYPRLYRWSIMYAPPANKARVLICAWVRPGQGKIQLYVASTAFAEFYPVRKADAVRLLGHNRYYTLGMADLQTFFRDVDALFALIEKSGG
jgi:hypothetical protein